MNIPLVAALGCIVLLLLIAIAVVILRRWGDGILGEIRDRAGLRGEDGLRGERMASFRGRLSDGAPVRGNAVALLTDRALYIICLWPRREFVIPLARVTTAEVSQEFMGATYRSGFFIVHYAGDGGPDAIALTLPKRADWAADVMEAVSRSRA